MQTQSANDFVNAALSLDDELQTEIYAMIQSPMTRIANDDRITREELLQVLQLKNQESVQYDSDSEQVRYSKFCAFPKALLHYLVICFFLRKLLKSVFLIRIT